ncbi:Smr/MutS family protein [Stakelama sediminis]
MHPPSVPAKPARGKAETVAPEPVRAVRHPSKPATPHPVRRSSPPVPPPSTLDSGWDRRITRGRVQPDLTIDLHGHTLASAHALLDASLDRAVREGVRVILLITGKPPRPGLERPFSRGAIRDAVPDWLGVSRHSDRIAAVRGAHPHHGGAGALYIILRRHRDQSPVF